MANTKGHDRLSRIWLPSEPLMKFKPIPYGGGPNSCGTIGLKSLGEAFSQAWHRAEVTGVVTVGMADELSVQMHMHPAEVYGLSWFLRDDFAEMQASW